jgi:dienelactone hydrolase
MVDEADQPPGLQQAGSLPSQFGWKESHLVKTTRLDAAAYQDAERLLRHNRGELVLGDKISPQWIDGGARFRYVVNTSEGRRFVLVDPKAGTREPAFDHGKIATALAAASGHDVDAAALPFGAVELNGEAVEFDAFGAHWRCRLDGQACEKSVGGTPGNPLEIPSPDGRFVVFRRDYDLWARSLEDSREWALTSDGDVDHDYGASPDPFMYSSMLKKLGLPHAPPAVSWSPDSRRVLTHRTVQRGVRQTHLMESLPDGGGAPRLLTLRQPFPGDDRLPLAELVVLDLEEGAVVPARVEAVAMPVMSPIFMKWAWWAEDGSAVYYLSRPRDVRTLRPHGFDPEKRYPVFDHPYPGPQANRVSPSFDPGFFGYDAEATAALGFVVMAVDGRGTPGRSKEFHDASYRRLADAGGLADHVAALEQLAATRPWMDLDRVGIFGHSGGGFAAVRAMLDFPGVFRVGVSEAGTHDNRYYTLGWGETYDGPYDEETYARASNVDIADRLEGKLLLIHGGLDENVSPHLTLRLVDRLIAADKDFELLLVPGAEHMFLGYERYVARRRWEFLVRHLMGAGG